MNQPKPTEAAMRAAKAIDKLLCENYGELSTGEAAQIIDREFAELAQHSQNLCNACKYPTPHKNRLQFVSNLESALAKLNAK